MTLAKNQKSLKRNLNNMTRELPTNELIQSVFGEDHPIPVGWNVIIQTYTPGDNFLADGESTVFERPDSTKDRDRYNIGVGRILAMGDAAFKGEHFKNWTLLPQVGDYVTFKKYQGTFNTNIGADGNKVENMDLKDYEILRIVRSPEKCGNFHFVGQ